MRPVSQDSKRLCETSLHRVQNGSRRLVSQGQKRFCETSLTGLLRLTLYTWSLCVSFVIFQTQKNTKLVILLFMHRHRNVNVFIIILLKVNQSRLRTILIQYLRCGEVDKNIVKFFSCHLVVIKFKNMLLNIHNFFNEVYFPTVILS